MYIYKYSCPAPVPQIKEEDLASIKASISRIDSSKIPKGVKLINSKHFSLKDIIALELAKKIEKDEVRIGYERLPVSFTTASQEEREALLNNLSATKERPCHFLKEILDLPKTAKKVKVYGLRPLPYEQSEGLVRDYPACKDYYDGFYQNKINLKEIHTKIDNELLQSSADRDTFHARLEYCAKLWDGIKLETPVDMYNKLKNNELYVPGKDLDETYSEQIIKNNLDIAVFGNIHIERVREKLELRGCRVSVILQKDSLPEEYAVPISNPDLVLMAVIS